MNERAQNPLETLLAGLRDALGELAPDTMAGRIRPVLEGFFEQFQLVPRSEYARQVATIERLERTVADLEARIARLEQR